MTSCFELTHVCIPLAFLNTRKYLSDAIPIQQCYAYGEIQADQHYEVIG